LSPIITLTNKGVCVCVCVDLLYRAPDWQVSCGDLDRRASLVEGSYLGRTEQFSERDPTVDRVVWPRQACRRTALCLAWHALRRPTVRRLLHVNCTTWRRWRWSSTSDVIIREIRSGVWQSVAHAAIAAASHCLTMSRTCSRWQWWQYWRQSAAPPRHSAVVYHCTAVDTISSDELWCTRGPQRLSVIHWRLTI